MFKFVLPCLCAWFMAADAQARQPAPPALTLADAHAKVVQNNQTLQSLQHGVQAQDGLVRQAGVYANPELSALIEDRERATRTTTIQLTQPIETGGKRGARIAAAERERELAQATLQVKRARLRADTSTAFHALLAAQERLDLAASARQLAADALAAAATRVAAGKNSPVDETRARIAASGAEIDLMQAQGELAQAREKLAVLWGGSGADVGRAAGALDRIPDAEPLEVLLARLQAAPEVALADAELRRRVALGRVEKARAMPDLALTIGSKKDEQLGRQQAVFGVSVPLPLLDRNQGRVQEAQQRTEQARLDLAAARAALASELRMAHGRLLQAKHQAGALQRDHLPGARSTVEAARKGYDYGKFSILDVFDAQRVLLQAQGQLVRVLAEGHAAAADIERILGASAAASVQESP